MTFSRYRQKSKPARSNPSSPPPPPPSSREPRAPALCKRGLPRRRPPAAQAAPPERASDCSDGRRRDASVHAPAPCATAQGVPVLRPPSGMKDRGWRGGGGGRLRGNHHGPDGDGQLRALPLHVRHGRPDLRARERERERFKAASCAAAPRAGGRILCAGMFAQRKVRGAYAWGRDILADKPRHRQNGRAWTVNGGGGG